MVAAAGAKAALSLFGKKLKTLADAGDEWATGQLRRLGALGDKTVKTQGTAREIGKGSPGSVVVKTNGGSRMARGAKIALKKDLKNELRDLTKKGIIRGTVGAGTVGAIGGAYALLGDDDEATEDTRQRTGLKGDGKGSGKSTGAKKESKTFRERRLARMKKRLEAAESEGRKRRLKRRIGRVEGRIEDTKERRAASKKADGGEMVKASVPGYKDGKLVKKQGANDRLDESLGERRGKESTKSQSMKSRRNESRGARKSSKPESAGVAKRGWGAVIR